MMGRPHRRCGARRAPGQRCRAHCQLGRAGKDVLGVGGAMDLVVGARRVIVTMTATSSGGEPKVVPECAYPLTARAHGRHHHRAVRVPTSATGASCSSSFLADATLDDVPSGHHSAVRRRPPGAPWPLSTPPLPTIADLERSGPDPPYIHDDYVGDAAACSQGAARDPATVAVRAHRARPRRSAPSGRSTPT